MGCKKSFLRRKFQFLFSLGAMMCFAPVQVNAGIAFSPSAPGLNGLTKDQVKKVIESLAVRKASNVGRVYVHYKGMKNVPFKHWNCILISPQYILMTYVGAEDIVMPTAFAAQFPSKGPGPIGVTEVEKIKMSGSEYGDIKAYHPGAKLYVYLALGKLAKPLEGITPFGIAKKEELDACKTGKGAMVATFDGHFMGDYMPISNDLVAGTMNVKLLDSDADRYLVSLHSRDASDKSSYTKYECALIQNTLGAPVYIQGKGSPSTPLLMGVSLASSPHHLAPSNKELISNFFRIDALLNILEGGLLGKKIKELKIPLY